MMDRNNTRSATTTTLTTPTATSVPIYPFLLGHNLSAYSTSLNAEGSHHKAAQQLPSSNPRIHGDSQIPIIDSSSGEDGALAASFDPAAAMAYANRGKPLQQEPELDGYDCESEEGVEVAEEHAKPATSRGSGSKRSRAAEVHNLSEKRRRSRINEKMKALQKLIPNSNKTDKASMLDEAIDYLKQLQLQVQMLSMRNGLTLNPPYMPPALQSLQIRYGSDSASSLMNIGMGMVSLDPTSSSSFALQNRGATTTSPHQNLGLGGVSNISDPIASFALGSSQSQHGLFRLPTAADEGIYAEEARHLNPSEMIGSASLHFEGQQQAPNANCVDRLNPQELASLDQSNHANLQHFQRGLEVRQDYPRGEVKAEESGTLKG